LGENSESESSDDYFGYLGRDSPRRFGPGFSRNVGFMEKFGDSQLFLIRQSLGLQSIESVIEMSHFKRD
jgi:hypothetical protein